MLFQFSLKILYKFLKSLTKVWKILENTCFHTNSQRSRGGARIRGGSFSHPVRLSLQNIGSKRKGQQFSTDEMKLFLFHIFNGKDNKEIAEDNILQQQEQKILYKRKFLK